MGGRGATSGAARQARAATSGAATAGARRTSGGATWGRLEAQVSALKSAYAKLDNAAGRARTTKAANRIMTARNKIGSQLKKLTGVDPGYGLF